MSYELVNRRTTNTLASFESEAEALSAYEQYAALAGDLAEDLVVVTFDDEGQATESELGSRLIERFHGTPQLGA